MRSATSGPSDPSTEPTGAPATESFREFVLARLERCIRAVAHRKIATVRSDTMVDMGDVVEAGDTSMIPKREIPPRVRLP